MPYSHELQDDYGEVSDEAAMLAMGGPIGSGVGVMIEVNATEQSSESQGRAAADQYYQQIEGASIT